MFSQDRKYFRFRFNRVLVLAFLLISPTQFTKGSGMPASRVRMQMHRLEFKALEEEMIPVRDFMEKELIPQWKKGNYANTQKSAEKLFQISSRSSTALAELVQAIRRDAKKGARDQRWSVFYGVGAIAVCVGSVFLGNIPVMVVTCGGSVGTIAFSVNSYYTLGDTLIKLDTLWEDITKMRTEIDKCAIRDVAPLNRGRASEDVNSTKREQVEGGLVE
ncbi:hypothetical protein OS493_004206 [Desmophyllum pertusum]|uniref:Uncharacterized protein n=1 Tax=Desmophyllum pertusum TaxID=174260 RepID=A0A9W9ZST0_9CNID|nr:hypothetical protein OS493_004206 [Desmophyllum pertusum]